MNSYFKVRPVMLACLVAIGATSAAEAFQGGADSSPNCNACHTGGTAPTATLSGSTTVERGLGIDVTLTITRPSGGTGVGGLNVKSSAETLSESSADLRIINFTEITHSAPLSFNGSTSLSRTFRLDTSAGAVCNSTLTLFALGLSANGNGIETGDLGASSTRNITIICPPTVSIANRSCTEGNTGSTACAFTITLGSAFGQDVTGNYATAAGGATPATAGTDYSAVTATAWSIAAGQLSTTVNVNISGDTADESDETFLVNLSSLNNAASTGNDLQATGTITDDDAANGQLRMTECVAEISELVPNVQITVERISGSNGAIGVSFATASGTAFGLIDYTVTSGTHSWPHGDVTTRTITVPIVNSTATENREFFNVNLSAPTGGASLGSPASTKVWILDGVDQIFEDGFGDLPPCT